MTSVLVPTVSRVVGGSLADAGFRQVGSVWTRAEGDVMTSFGVFDDGGPTSVLMWGWNYAALGDSVPVPADVTGCARRLPLDDLAPTHDLRRLRSTPSSVDEDAWFAWEHRLLVAWQSSIQRWLLPWRRPDGYRDFVSHHGWHLGAAWISAVLGQHERARLELARADLLIGRSLDDSFDRHRADHDLAIAMPMAASRGLAGLLDEATRSNATEVTAAFDSVRGSAPRAKVTEPLVEHERFATRQRVVADLCREFLGV